MSTRHPPELLKYFVFYFNLIRLVQISFNLSSAKKTQQDTNFLYVDRDVDDPEYKPAPALLKDDMEVRSQDSKVNVAI